MYWCFFCYGVNHQPRGACEVCGRPIQGPEGLSETGRLTWTLRHPDSDRAVLAAQRLGDVRAQGAVPALCELLDEATTDPYLAAAILQALIQIQGVAALRDRLESIERDGPLLQQHVAQAALRQADH